MNLYHYYEKGRGPFLTLSDLSIEEARRTQEGLKEAENVYAKRDFDGMYMDFRRIVESNMRSTFIEKGGKPVRQTPFYCILGLSHERNHKGYKEWYKCPEYIEISLDSINTDTISFTYGDSFIENHPKYREQLKYHERIFSYDEILILILNRGWPQDFVSDDSPFWMPRYIEAQLWSDEVICKYC